MTIKIRAIDRLLGGRNGLIRGLSSIETPVHEAALYAYTCERGRLPWEPEEQEDLYLAGGIGHTRFEALMRCCGEAMERYCSSFVPKDLPKGTRSWMGDQGFEALSLSKFQFFSKAQHQNPAFPFHRPSEETVPFWCRGRELTTGSEVWLPAFSVYFPYFQEPEMAYGPVTTSGLSCGPDVEQATRGACLELIERDAFTNFWLNQLSPPQLRLEGVRGERLKRLFRCEELGVRLLDLTSELGIPVVAAFTFGDSSFGEAAALGLGCHFDPYVAVEKALLENALARRAIHYRRSHGLLKTYRDDFLDVMSFDDHMTLYCAEPRFQERLSFLFKNPTVQAPKPGPIRDVESMCSMLRDKGIEMVVVDVTTPDVEALGFRVVRAVSPLLSRLHGMFPYPFLGGQRLYRPHEVFEWAQSREVSEARLLEAPPHMLG